MLLQKSLEIYQRKENKMQKTIHLMLKPEDSDILGWKSSLPHRALNKTVNEILLAESKGKIAEIPFEFSSIENATPLSCVIRVADENVARFVDSLPKGDKAESIKKIIRKHIRKNKELPPNEVGIPAELLATKIESLKELLIEKANSCVGEHDKNRKLKAIYEKVVTEIFDSIPNCYPSDDEEKGDDALQSLNVERIVNIEFDMIFDKLFKILSYGIPDEEFESVINHIRTTEENK